jgi:hypothetical protein
VYLITACLTPSSFKVLDSSLKSCSAKVFPLHEVSFDDHVVDRLKFDLVSLGLPVLQVGVLGGVLGSAVPLDDSARAPLDDSWWFLGSCACWVFRASKSYHVLLEEGSNQGPSSLSA